MRSQHSNRMYLTPNIKTSKSGNEAQSMTEYVLILALISIAVILVMSATGHTMFCAYTYLRGKWRLAAGELPTGHPEDYRGIIAAGLDGIGGGDANEENLEEVCAAL